MPDNHRAGATCVGKHCDLCDEMHCADRFVTIDNLAICPVCIMKLAPRGASFLVPEAH